MTAFARTKRWVRKSSHDRVGSTYDHHCSISEVNIMPKSLKVFWKMWCPNVCPEGPISPAERILRMTRIDAECMPAYSPVFSY